MLPFCRIILWVPIFIKGNRVAAAGEGFCIFFSYLWNDLIRNTWLQICGPKIECDIRQCWVGVICMCVCECVIATSFRTGTADGVNNPIAISISIYFCLILRGICRRCNGIGFYSIRRGGVRGAGWRGCRQCSNGLAVVIANGNGVCWIGWSGWGSWGCVRVVGFCCGIDFSAQLHGGCEGRGGNIRIFEVPTAVRQEDVIRPAAC